MQNLVYNSDNKKSSYYRYSKDELIKEIKILKKRKKYSLVWEEKSEEVVN